jgi:hypothetical protein
MNRPQHPRATELRDLATIVAAIDADGNPSNADIATSIVNTELAKLAEETWDSQEEWR